MPDSGSEQEPAAATSEDGYDYSVDARLATGAELGGPDLEDQLRKIHGCSRRQYQDAQKRTDAMLAECFGGKVEEKDGDKDSLLRHDPPAPTGPKISRLVAKGFRDLTLELPPFIDSAECRFVAESVRGPDGDAVCQGFRRVHDGRHLNDGWPFYDEGGWC